MSTKKYYCFCGSNCKYETMTKEQIMTAIADATGAAVIDPDAAYISQIREKNNGKGVTFWVGTQAQYNALPSVESTCLYIISDDNSAAALEAELKAIKDSIAEKPNAVHEHNAADITAGILPIARGGTGNSTGRVTAGQKADTALGSNATAEGAGTTASGNNCHAEGVQTVASALAAHAEGNQTEATAIAAHAEGYKVLAGGNYSHAEGWDNKAEGTAAHAEGWETLAEGDFSHAEGNLTEATGTAAHAEGCLSVAIGSYSHAEGYFTYAEGYASHAAGYETNANGDNQYVIGHYNKISSYGSLSGDENANTDYIDQLIVGNGTVGQKSNSLRLRGNGQLFIANSLNNSGADYAEYFEWADGNPDNEDRRGLFVTVEGEKIKVATEGDYILGVVSGQPCIIGNSDIDWQGRFMTDEYGTVIKESYEYEVKHIDAETGETIVEYRTGSRPKQNPDYDENQPYIQRADRKEWAAVGMVGVLAVRDDGSCKVNSYCKVAADGTAIASTSAKTGYRVISRVNDHIVKVIVK